MHVFDGMPIAIKDSGKVSVGELLNTFCGADRSPDTMLQINIFSQFEVFA